MITLTCDIGDALKQVRSLQQDQLPFIIAKSLTSVAQEAQKAVRVQEGQVFKLRNDWTQKQTKITPATKQLPVAEVYTDTGSGSDRPDYLTRQEYGGPRTHYGTEYFAIPTKYLRAIQPNTIPAPMRPYNLLPIGAEIGQVSQGRLEMPGIGWASQFGRVGKRKLKKLGTSQFAAFKKYDKRGTLCIFVRLANSRVAEPWYVLVKNAHLTPRLEMQKIVAAVVAADFADIFATIAKDVGVEVKLV